MPCMQPGAAAARVGAVLSRALAARRPAAQSALAPAEEPAYRDLNRSFEERAADLVARMTLEEKIAQLRQQRAGDPATGRAGVRVVERGPARRRARRRGDGVPAGDRPRGDFRSAL